MLGKIEYDKVRFMVFKMVMEINNELFLCLLLSGIL
jgi:hypothetical protein